MIKNNASVFTSNENGDTPFDLAKKRGDKKIVEAFETAIAEREKVDKLASESARFWSNKHQKKEIDTAHSRVIRPKHR